MKLWLWVSSNWRRLKRLVEQRRAHDEVQNNQNPVAIVYTYSVSASPIGSDLDLAGNIWFRIDTPDGSRERCSPWSERVKLKTSTKVVYWRTIIAIHRYIQLILTFFGSPDIYYYYYHQYNVLLSTIQCITINNTMHYYQQYNAFLSTIQCITINNTLHYYQQYNTLLLLTSIVKASRWMFTNNVLKA